MKAPESVADEVDGLFSELAAMEASYQIPEGAITFDDLRKKFPNIPEAKLRKQLQERVQRGEMKKARRGQVTYFWTAK
jgi:hypothetical protein